MGLLYVWRLWDRASLEQRCKQLTRCNKFRLLILLLIFLIQLYMSRTTTRPSSGALFECIYSFWYSAPILLPTGNKVEMELHLNSILNSWTTATQLILSVLCAVILCEYGECNNITEGIGRNDSFYLSNCMFLFQKIVHSCVLFLRCNPTDVISTFWRQVKPVYKPYVTGIYRSTGCFNCTVRINRQDGSSND